MKSFRSAIICACFAGHIFAQPLTTVDRSHLLDAQWQWAIWQGDIDWVKELMAKGYKLDVRVKSAHGSDPTMPLPWGGVYPIAIAVDGGSPEMVEFLLSRGVKTNVKDQHNEPLTHLAYNKPRLIPILTKYKVNMLAQDSKGDTIMHSAIGHSTKLSEESREVVELLKSNTKLLKLNNKAGLTPIDQALQSKNREALAIIAPHRIAEIDKKEKAAELAEEKAKKQKREKDLAENCGMDGFWFSDKLLHEAMTTNNAKMALCAAKKDPILTTPTWDRHIPHLLYNYRNEKITEIIIQHSSAKKLNEKSIAGNAFTVIYDTFRADMKASWVKMLLKKGVDPDVTVKGSETPREMACIYGDDEIVKALPTKDTGKNFKPGTKVWIRGEREAKIKRSCKSGAVVLLAGKREYFTYSDINMESDAARRAKNNPGASGGGGNSTSDAKRDKSRDIPAGTLVRVTGKSFNEPTRSPGSSASCESTTTLRRMADGYWRGTINCGGSATYTYNVGVSVERVGGGTSSEPSYQSQRCLENCLDKCGRPALGTQPSYSNQVCRDGCFNTCK